jgi:hypothetical protein
MREDVKAKLFDLAPLNNEDIDGLKDKDLFNFYESIQ